MAAAFLRVLTVLALAGLALALGSGAVSGAVNRGGTESAAPQDEEMSPDEPAADEPAGEEGTGAAEPGAEEAGAGEAGGGDESAAPAAEDPGAPAAPEQAPPPPPQGALRRRPRTAEEERAWKELNAPNDPFLYTPPVLGPAPGVGEFYNPQDYIDPQLTPGLSRYIIQDSAGQVVGYLTLSLEHTVHPELGACVAARLYYDDDNPAELTLWLDPHTLQPRRLQRQLRLVPGAHSAGPTAADPGAAAGPAPPAAPVVVGVDGPEAPLGEADKFAAQIASLQRIPQDRVDYVFDAVRHWHSGGGITTSRSMRQLPFSYELASLPVLARQLKPHGGQWPFRAPLVDGTALASLELTVAEPMYATTLSAEPATCQCYELHFSYGGAEQVFWVERSLPRRLVKFSCGGRTYNLFEYSESKQL